jgi:hypothetical protein
MDEHQFDLWNYFYRGILSFAFAAEGFGDHSLFESIRKFRDEFERVSERAA